MLVALSLAAALQIGPQLAAPAQGRFCARDGLEQAGQREALYREGDRPAEQRRLDELPDADMVLTVLKRDETGCPIVEVVRRGVSSRGGAAGDRSIRPPRLAPEARPQRDR